MISLVSNSRLSNSRRPVSIKSGRGTTIRRLRNCNNDNTILRGMATTPDPLTTTLLLRLHNEMTMRDTRDQPSVIRNLLETISGRTDTAMSEGITVGWTREDLLRGSTVAMIVMVEEGVTGKIGIERRGMDRMGTGMGMGMDRLVLPLRQSSLPPLVVSGKGV